jgi:hypothetical protein
MTHELEVWVQRNYYTGEEEIHYSNGTGNLTVRGTGISPHPKIRFALRNKDWTFESISFVTIEGVYVQPNGADVFDVQVGPPGRLIEMIDNLSLQDVGTIHRYKYTLTLRKMGDDGNEPLVSDPEIQNEREPRLGGG